MIHCISKKVKEMKIYQDVARWPSEDDVDYAMRIIKKYGWVKYGFKDGVLHIEELCEEAGLCSKEKIIKKFKEMLDKQQKSW